MRLAKTKVIRNILSSMVAAIMLFSIVMFSCTTAAQTSTHSQNTGSIYEMLSGSVVTCMLQDSEGFLWFGTQSGLYRYNGYNIKSYSFNSTLPNKSAANFITSICEDNSKNIWLGTFGGGLFKLDPITEEYVHFNHNANVHDGLGDNIVRAICKDDSGKLWIGTQNNGLDYLDPVSGHFMHYKNTVDNANSISSNAITSIVIDKEGTLWVGTVEGGLNKFDSQTGKFLHYKNQANTPGNLLDNSISKLFIDRTNILWIITGDGNLSKFDPTSGGFLNDDLQMLKDYRITAVCEDISGSLWIGTYGSGVKILDKDSGAFITHGCDFSQDTSSYHYKVISLYADSSGNLWVSAEGFGIDKINTNRGFITYRSNMDSQLSFSDDVVLSIYKDKSGIVWIGTANGGVNRFDRESSRVTSYKNKPEDINSISSNTVNSIFEDSHGTLWFGTIDGVLNSFNTSSEKFTRYKVNDIENPHITDNGILRIHESNEGMIWACTANLGLIRLDRSTGQYMQFTNDPSNSSSISSDHVLSIAEDKDGTIWLGTSGGGLNKMNPSTFSFIHYGLSEKDSGTQTFDYCVNAIVNDDGILWLATDRGVYKFDKSSGKSVPIEDIQGITHTSIFGLLKDGKDNLWLSTSNGLIKYTEHSGALIKYNFSGGLQKNQYIAGAYFKSADDEMFFGGTNGFSCFYADNIMNNTHEPPVIITSFKIFDTPIKLTDSGEISITYKDDFFSFEFAALDYADPQNNQYAYMLEGFDTDWHYNGTRNYASYTNLDGGEYVFRIKASNNDGIWNTQDTQIKLFITSPFWETTWFNIAAFIFTFAAIFVLIKRTVKLKNAELERQVMERTKELNRANKQLRYADEMKSDFLSVVSHEIRTPLSSILGFTELIAGKFERIILPVIDLTDKKIQKAAENINRDLNIVISEGDRLSSLVSNLLNLSKIESGKTDWTTEIFDISEIIEHALSSTKPNIDKAGLTVHLDVEADLPKVSGNKDTLIQVFINLLSNAVKFTMEGYIKVCVKNSGDNLFISIEDTGVGIPEDHLDKIFERFYKVDPSLARSNESHNTGLGLYICKQIIEKHGGKIWAESQSGKGSIFHFTIPHLRVCN